MNRKNTKRVSAFFFMLFFGCTMFLEAYAEDWYKSKIIIVDGWAELEDPSELPNVPDIFDGEIEEEEKKKILQASQQIREIISEILSGMIYGYTFSYTPRDKARTVEEQFTLNLIGSISYNDSNLSVINTDIYDASLFLLSRYNLNNAQVRRAELWNNATAYPSDGTGIAIIRNSLVQSKIDALYDAIRDGVRRRLQLQLPNKPKLVKGRVRISKNPLFVRSGQSYISKVTIDIMVSDTERYEAF